MRGIAVLCVLNVLKSTQQLNAHQVACRLLSTNRFDAGNHSQYVQRGSDGFVCFGCHRLCVVNMERESKCACAMVTVFHSTTSTTSITSSVLLDDGTSTIRSNIEHLTLKNTHKILYPTHRPQTKFNAVRSLSQHIRIYKFLPTAWIGFGCRHLAVKWSLEMTITCFSQIWLLPFKWTMNASSQLCTTDLSASSI